MPPTATRPAPGELAAATVSAGRYQQVRNFSEFLCEPLVPEDYVIQSMADVSPAKWHLAHTSWFFETFILGPLLPGYTPFHPDFSFLFNSYYNAVGQRHCRPQRGLVSRPTVQDTYAYRRYVDDHMMDLLRDTGEASIEKLGPLLDLGLHHEQQHQELMLTDIKHVFTMNPLRPVYRPREYFGAEHHVPPLQWISFPEAVYDIGATGNEFCFDNETPRHRELLQPFALGSRLVTNGEYLQFIEDGGYRRPEFWLSLGWNTLQQHGWEAPFYWERQGDAWHTMTLAGMLPVDPAEPVCHINYFEADAYAQWCGARLPGEGEWEAAASALPVAGNLVEQRRFHPAPAPPAMGLTQMFGDVWEWTRSAYLPYPGYRPPAGALGEYNGKFMCNQFVLRGGSCATSQTHIRPTYRNFFPPDASWQFSGIRLARDL